MSNFTEFYKSMKDRLEKPGAGTHSEKWDRCVRDVKASGSASDPYAVCTAMLKSQTFKSMDDQTFGDKIKFYLQKLGLAAAGPIPNSLLARQDLAGETTQKSQETKLGLDNGFAVWYYDELGAQKCAIFSNIIDASAYATLVDAMGYKNVEIVKGQVEQTGKQLEAAAAKAEDVDSKTEEKSLVQRIKNIQVKRQKAVMNERASESKKSFSQFWAGLGRGSR